MFSTLESNWDQSARRGWSTLASFGFQAMALSLLLMIPYFWIQGPPHVTWLQPVTMPVSQPTPTPPDLETSHRRYSARTISNILNDRLIAPRYIPTTTTPIDDREMGPPAPFVPGIDFGPAGKNSVPYTIGANIPVIVPKPPAPNHPIKVSRLSEANVVYRVQPVYPSIARAAGIQGAVVLRAIISKNGVIEHLTAVSGHPMLIKAAADAVQQWRYRPYLLNDEPIEIDTEITVNFVLSR